MKNKILLLSLLALAPAYAAHADWSPRLQCGEALVVEGNYVMGQGFTAYRLTLSQSEAVSAFDGLAVGALSSGGTIKSAMKPENFGDRFDGSLRAPLAHGYQLLGQWSDATHYRLMLSQGKVLGEQIIANCKALH